MALRARTWSGSSCHRGSPVAVRACGSQRRGWRSHVAPELQPAPPCGAGVRDVTWETTGRSEDIRPVTIRRVPRGSPGCLAPFALALLHGVGLGGSWHFAPPLCASPRPAGLGNRGAAGDADAAGPGSRLPPSPVSRPLPRAGPVPLLREEERSPFLHVRLAGGGEAAVSFSESHLQPAPLSPSGSQSSILSLRPPRWPVPHALSLPTPDQPAAHSHSWCVARAPAASQTSWGKIHTHCLTSAQRSRPSPPGPPLLLVSPHGQCDSHAAFRPGSRRPGSPRPALAVLVRTLRATHPPPGGRDLALQGAPALRPGRRLLTLVTAAGGHLPPVWEAPGRTFSLPCAPLHACLGSGPPGARDTRHTPPACACRM